MTTSSVDIAAAVRALRPQVANGVAELAHDLSACWRLERLHDVSGWMSKPAILRRVGSLLGGRVGADIDRLVATGPGATALGAAVSLSTGLPFAVRVAEGSEVIESWGEIHEGESLCVVSSLASRAKEALSHLDSSTSCVALVDDEGDAEVALFRIHGDELVPKLVGDIRAERDEIARLVSGLMSSEGTADLWLETAASPARLAKLGERIAGVVSAFAPQAIACWLNEDEAALAQTVAQVLAIPVARVNVDLGIMTISPDLPPHVSHVLMLSSSWNSQRPAAPLARMLRNTGKEVVAAVSLFGEGYPVGDIDASIPIIVLGGS